jgi:uncharacterized protein YndB with AHSA1/START domain
MYVYASKTIDRPIEAVWEVVTDVARMDQWSPVEGSIDFTVRTEGALVGVGSRLIRRYDSADGEPIGESIVEVSEYNPPRRLALSAVDLDTDMTFTIQLDPSEDDSTIVALRNGDSVNTGLLGIFQRRSQRRMLARMLNRLKRQVEGEQPT